MQAKRSLFQRIVIKLRGIVWQSKTAYGTKITLYRSGYVVYSDKQSSDAVPLFLCSHKLIAEIERDIATL